MWATDLPPVHLWWLSAKAITDVELLFVDDEVLDILATWDQVAAGNSGDGAQLGHAMRSDAMLITGAFSLSNLRSGAFAQLPSP